MSEYTNIMEQLPLNNKPGIPVFSSMLDLYFSKLSSKALPKWSDFGMKDFIGWHANIALSEKDGDDFRFRIFGSAFSDLFGTDFTGKFLCDSIAQGHTDAVRRHFSILVEEKKIGWVKGQLPIEGRDYLPFEVLDLPLQDEQGEVSRFIHILGVLH